MLDLDPDGSVGHRYDSKRTDLENAEYLAEQPAASRPQVRYTPDGKQEALAHD
jgi:hypothetical protein